MTILTRYVVALFLPAFFLFFLALLALSITIDVAVNLKRLLDLRDVPILSFVREYYPVKELFVIPYLLPSALVFASLFTVVRLGRSGEITPMLMAGVSLRRISAPFFAVAGACVAILAAHEEWVLPRAAARMGELEQMLYGSGSLKRVGARAENGSRLFAAQLEVGKGVLTEVVAEIWNGHERTREIRCRRAEWRAGPRAWRFFEGEVFECEGGRYRIVTLPDGRSAVARSALPAEGEEFAIGIAPGDFLRSGFFEERRTLEEWFRRVERSPTPENRTALYARFTEPWSPLIVLSIVLPLVVGRMSAAAGGALAVLLLLSVFGVQIVCFSLGAEGALPPAAAVLLPPVLLGGAGLWLFAHMRT